MSASVRSQAYGIAPPGYRLPASTRLGVVRLQVANLTRSLEWYRRVLGLEPLDRPGRVAHLGVPGAATPLVELHEHPGAAPVPRRGRLGLYHYAILLPDRPALGQVLRHLTDIGERAGMSDHLVSEALYLTDPDGLGIEVYADRPRSAWRQEDRQLTMATNPLDVQAVLGAAGNERWSGMPSGTVLGHVHLFVADLERAAAFYHAGLGLDKTVWSYPGALFLSAGGYHHHLGINTWATGAVPAGPDEARLLEWEVFVPSVRDAAEAIASIAAAGGTVEHSADGGVARDPWGTAVRVRGDGATTRLSNERTTSAQRLLFEPPPSEYRAPLSRAAPRPPYTDPRRHRPFVIDHSCSANPGRVGAGSRAARRFIAHTGPNSSAGCELGAPMRLCLCHS